MGSFTDSTVGSYEHNKIEIYGTGDANFWKGLGRSLTDCKKGGRRRRIFYDLNTRNDQGASARNNANQRLIVLRGRCRALILSSV